MARHGGGAVAQGRQGASAHSGGGEERTAADARRGAAEHGPSAAPPDDGSRGGLARGGGAGVEEGEAEVIGRATRVEAVTVEVGRATRVEAVTVEVGRASLDEGVRRATRVEGTSALQAAPHPARRLRRAVGTAGLVRHVATRHGIIGAAFGHLAARRALVPFIGTVAYLDAIALRVDRGAGGRPWLVGGLSLALAFGAASPRLPGNALREDGRREVGLFALSLWGLALVLASLGSLTPDLVQDLAGGLAAFGGATTAARALARVRGGLGVALSLPSAPPALLPLTLAMLGTAFGLAMLASFRSMREPLAGAWDPRLRDTHAIAAGVSLLVLAGSSWETLRVKRLVLEVGDRTWMALIVVVATCAVALVMLIEDAGAPDRVLRGAVAVAAVGATFACTAGDAVTLARWGRRSMALLLFGGPVVLLGGLAAQGPGRAFPALLVTGVAALAVGSVVQYLERPLRRAEGRLLYAVELAHLALVRADPELSIRDALAALRTFAGTTSQSPELWSLVPGTVLTIDGAGYPHERAAALPDPLVRVATDEVEATIRAELLEALVVRRPDLRPLTRWMDERSALSATLILREGEVSGVLVLPRGSRSQPMSLEEVVAVKRLADAFSGALEAREALVRSFERERMARERADALEEALLERDARANAAMARTELVAARLAGDAESGPYAPGARVAFEAIVRRLELGAPLVVVAPQGSNVIAYIARAHLGTPRGKMPFVVVDGASLQQHDLGRWADPVRSPLALADRGLLVLEDGARLPIPVQGLVGEALALRRGPWDGALDLTVALTATPADTLSLDPSLAARWGDALEKPVVWPPLRERGEDLQSLVVAGLAREGMRARGAPLGIDDAAFARLAEYAYPGDEAELRSLMQRLALLACGDVVRVGDVRDLGLG